MLICRLLLFKIAMIPLLAGCAVAPAAPTQTTAATAAPAPPASPADSAPRDEPRRTATANLSDAARAATGRAQADLAQRLGISETEIELLGVQPEYTGSGKSDTAGTPSGWRIRLGVGAEVYLYQVDARGTLKRLPGRR